MAVAGETNHYRTTGAVYARGAWQALQRQSTNTFEKLWAFLTAHPSTTQGVYYVVFGLWPVVHVDSFLKVTGPKTDVWLVQTMGMILAIIGGTLCLAAYRRQKSPEMLMLGMGSAVALAGADLLFVFGGHIATIYLADAAVELIIVFLWLHAWYTENVVRVATITAPSTHAVNGQTVAAAPLAQVPVNR